MNSWSSGSWNTIPTVRRMSGSVFFVKGRSPIRTSPAVGERYPFRWSRRVDFPAPLAPMTATDSPWVIRNVTSRKATVPSG